jgi:thioredoxin reductase (NADPH)
VEPAACRGSRLSPRRRARSWSGIVDDHGYVLTGSDMRAADHWALDRDPYLLETSVPGIFACGDVRLGPVKRVAAAVGEGSMAIAFVHQYLKDAQATR